MPATDADAFLKDVAAGKVSDPRLPLVNWSLTTRHGSFEDPKGKEGLSSLSDGMLRRGVAEFLEHERAQKQVEMTELATLSPFRCADETG